MSFIQIDFIPLDRPVRGVLISQREETEKTSDQDATAQLNSKAAPIPLFLRPSSYIWVFARTEYRYENSIIPSQFKEPPLTHCFSGKFENFEV